MLVPPYWVRLNIFCARQLLYALYDETPPTVEFGVVESLMLYPLASHGPALP